MTTSDDRTPYTPGHPSPYATGGYVPAPGGYEPQPTSYWPPQSQPYVPPVKPRGPRRFIVLIAGLAVVLLAAAAVGAYLLFAPGGGNGGVIGHVAGLSEQSAQRACRTAFENEWDKRVNTVNAGETDTTIVASVQGIDVQETWKTGSGYSVNGVVRYTLTTAFIDPVDDTINLTCQARGTDDNVTTTVTNR